MTEDSVPYHRLDRPEEVYNDRTPLLRNILYVMIFIVIGASVYVIHTGRAKFANASVGTQKELVHHKFLVESKTQEPATTTQIPPPIVTTQKETTTLTSPTTTEIEETTTTIPQVIPPLRKRPEVADINCKRIFDGDVDYTKSVGGDKRRKIVPSKNLDMNCTAIRERILPARNPNEGFPIAYAKVVHEQYEFLEEQLAVTYSEENWYCFAPDLKATPEFHNRFIQLAYCLPNVILAAKEYKTDSAGHYHTNAFFDCLRHLKAKAWNYIIFLQNNDIMVKPNREIVKIMQTMDGANDMELMHCTKDGRCDHLETNLGKLDLCPKQALSAEARAACDKKNLTWGKGSVQVTLSRQTADFLTDNVDYQPLQDELNKNKYGIDEVFLQTLMVTEELGVPGHYPARCLIPATISINKHIFMTRLSHWSWLDKACGSNHWRHSICVFGIEDIKYLAGVDYIMANKLMSDFDYGAISCIGELLYNRTWLGQDDHPLNISVYENLPLVRLHKLEQSHPTNASEIFECPKV